MSSASALDPAERERSLANLKLEQDAVVLYDRLAGIEKDPRRAASFRTIAGNERRHAEVWSQRLREMGVQVPPPGPPRLRVRFIIGVARVFGTRAVSDLVRSLEGDEGELYESQSDPDVAAIMADEREHAEIWQRMDAGLPGVAQDSDIPVSRLRRSRRRRGGRASLRRSPGQARGLAPGRRRGHVPGRDLRDQ